MVEFFPKGNPKIRRLDTLKVGDCFSIYAIGHSDFEIFTITDSVKNDMISAVSLKTGNLLPFTREFVVYPLDLKVIYSHQH